jgi:hypothetical protein
MKKWIITLCAMLFAVASASQAALINVDLGAGTWVGSSTAGVVASDGWQLKSSYPNFSNLSLNYADGTASGATISGYGSGNVASVGAATTDGDYLMFNKNLGAFALNQGASTITVNNLSMGGAYDVYVYFAANANPAGVDYVDTFAISDGTTTYYIKADETQASYQGTYIQSTATVAGDAIVANYVKFSNLSASTLALSFGNLRNDDAGAAGVSGIQIVSSVVPEPATIGMLGLGAVVSMLIRRIRG